MIDDILLSIYLIVDAIQQKRLSQLLHDFFFLSRVAVPVYQELQSLKDLKNPFLNSEYQFVEVTRDSISASKLNFSSRSRYYKALHNLKKGLRGFILYHDSTIIGDIWCHAPRGSNKAIRHPDLDLLGIAYTNQDGYALDMFIDPAYRGKKLAVPFHQAMQNVLKNESWNRLYAYYYEDNLSSRWMHWMLKYKELPKVSVSRFFSIIRVSNYVPDH